MTLQSECPEGFEIKVTWGQTAHVESDDPATNPSVVE